MLEKILSQNKYDFLKNMKNPPMLVTFGGSHAYGTNIETSDIDIRGISYMNKHNLLGFTGFEQYEDKNTDTTLYSFNKAIDLFTNCNPNVIEILGCKEYFLTEQGKLLLDNKEIFLSKRAIDTFGGYAIAQLNRLKNALARDSYTSAEQEEHRASVLNHIISGFNYRYETYNNGKANCYLTDDGQLKVSLSVDMNIKELKSILTDITNAYRSFDKLNVRNNKKDNQHLCKHAMHLVRLYLMLKDILNGEIKTYRDIEHSLLMDIRQGKYMKDGRFITEFFDMINTLQNEIDILANKSILPKNPDYKAIERLKITINEVSLSDNTFILEYVCF